MARKPKMPTNIEFIKRYINDSNPLNQVFVMDCVGKLADAILADEDAFREEMKGHFIHADAWIAVARQWRDDYEEYFHPTPKPEQA